MAFPMIDRYLLGEPVSKASLVESLLANRSPLPAAAPFYRALEAVGVRAADEAFVALRIVLGGGIASDERVRRLRALSNAARLGRNGDSAQLVALFARDAVALADLPQPPAADLAAVAAAAAERYRAELGEPSGRISS